MAKPFRIFRKYQQQMLIFFGVLLMFVFVVGGVLMQSMDSGPGRNSVNTVSVSWDGASYNEAELSRFRNYHLAAQQFLQQLAMLAQQEGGMPRSYPDLIGLSNPPDDSYQDVAMILLLADEANRQGLAISDAMVDNFINRVGDSQFSEADHIRLLKQIGGSEFSLPKLREQLKIELAALRFQEIIFSGIRDVTGTTFVTPLTALATEQRINQTLKVEFLPIEVEPYLEKVSETPSNSELRQLYQFGAVRFPDPTHQFAGFRRPDKAKVQWFAVGQDQFLPPAESITEEAIKAEYDRRVAEKDLSVIQPPEPPATEPPAPQTPDGDSTSEEPENTDGETTDTPPTTDEDSQETSETQDDSTETTTETDTEATSDDQESTEDTTDTDGGSDQSSLPSTDNQLRFVSTPVQEESTSDTTEESSQESEDTDQTSESATGDETATPPTQETETTQDPADETTPPVDEPVFKTLEEVRDTIVSDLQRDAAQIARQAAISQINSRLEDYFIEHEKWDALRFDDESLPRPTPPDFQKWADEFGIEFSETEGVVDFIEFSQTTIGQSFGQIPPNFNFQQQSFPTVAQTLFGQFQQAKPFAASTTLLNDYIYWITDKEESFVPQLDECKEDVANFWKWSKAVELAKADAAKKIEQAGSGSLVSAFTGDAYETDTFTWLSIGGGNIAAGGGQLSLSTIAYTDGEETKNLEDLSNTFMTDVSKLEIGETTVTVDGLNETVFAVKLIDKSAPTELIEATVQNQTLPSTNAMRVVNSDMGEFQRDWLFDLQQRRGVRWVVKSK